MKVSKNELRLLLLLAGLLIFVALYFFVYNGLVADNDKIAAAIDKLEPTLAELEKHEANYDTYQAEIEAISDDIAVALKNHPSKIENEEFLTWLIDWSQTNGLDVNAVAFMGTTPMGQFPLFIEDNSGKKSKTEVFSGRVLATVSAHFGYDELKDAVDAIYANKQETALENITITYDVNTGTLSGNFSISKFYLNYEGAPYESYPIPEVDLGKELPFGTVE